MTRPLRRATLSRYPSAIRQARDGKPPQSVLIEGHTALAFDIANYLELAVAPDEVRFMEGEGDLATLGLDEAGPQRRLLVRWERFEEVPPSPAVAAALLRLGPTMGTWVVAVHDGFPSPEPWHYCFRWRVLADMTAKEASAWVQTLTKVPMEAAARVIERRPEPIDYVSAARSLALATERATAEDVDRLILPVAEVALAAALLRCDKRGALALAPGVVDHLAVAERLYADICTLWVLAENVRAMGRFKRSSEADEALGLTKGATARLSAMVRLWSRQKVGERLGLLADVLEAAGAPGAWERAILLW